MRRLSVSGAIIAIVLITIFWLPAIFCIVAISVFSVLALKEFCGLVEGAGRLVDTKLALVIGGLFPFLFSFSGAATVLALTFLIVLYFAFTNGKPGTSFEKSAITVFGLVYITWFLSFFVKIRFLTDGALWVTYVLAVTKTADAGAYFIGTSFGKTKVFGAVSPQKSLEGAIAAFVVAIVVSCGFKIFFLHIPFMHFVLLGIAMGLLTQLGDLAESLIKRELGSKDSGLLPGLGGALDIIDSLLFTAPYVYYYLTTILIRYI